VEITAAYRQRIAARPTLGPVVPFDALENTATIVYAVEKKVNVYVWANYTECVRL
jgi:hypothetical protein